MQLLKTGESGTWLVFYKPCVNRTKPVCTQHGVPHLTCSPLVCVRGHCLAQHVMSWGRLEVKEDACKLLMFGDLSCSECLSLFAPL